MKLKLRVWGEQESSLAVPFQRIPVQFRRSQIEKSGPDAPQLPAGTQGLPHTECILQTAAVAAKLKWPRQQWYGQSQHMWYGWAAPLGARLQSVLERLWMAQFRPVLWWHCFTPNGQTHGPTPQTSQATALKNSWSQPNSQRTESSAPAELWHVTQKKEHSLAQECTHTLELLWWSRREELALKAWSPPPHCYVVTQTWSPQGAAKCPPWNFPSRRMNKSRPGQCCTGLLHSSCAGFNDDTDLRENSN